MSGTRGRQVRLPGVPCWHLTICRWQDHEGLINFC